jgi:plastocyanin
MSRSTFSRVGLRSKKTDDDSASVEPGTATVRKGSLVRRIVLLLGVVVLALAAVVGGNAATRKDAYDLKGEVYASGFRIEMVNRANQHLRTVKAGTYRIKIEDKASMHNFHLTGPGVNKSTSVGGVTETTWTVRLKPGTYTYACDAHAQMRKTFRVTR